MNYNRGQMKSEVKRIMKMTRPRPIWVTLLYLLIAAAGGWLLQTVLGSIMGVGMLTEIGNEFMEAMMYAEDVEYAMEVLLSRLMQNIGLLSGLISGSILISILTYLWQSLMSVGYVGYSLDMVRCANPTVGKLFCAFPKFGAVILTKILVGIFQFLWVLLAVVGVAVVMVIAVLLMDVIPVVGVLLIVVGYIGMIVFLIRIMLRYAMVDYLLMDQGLSGLEAIRVSKQLMKGQKGRLFMLRLSFIGWYLLEMVIIYVGIILMVLCAMPMIAAEGAAPSMAGVLAGVGLILVVAIVLVVVALLFTMWLTPYTAGSVAKFYEFTLSQRPDLFTPRTNTYTDDSFGNPNYPKLD